MVDRGDSLFYYWDKSCFSRQIVSINSSDRIDAANTKSNDFTVYLKTPLLNVCAIKLISTITPNTQYVINASNNVIDFISRVLPGPVDTAYSVTIAPGTYTATELANAINSAMNTALGAPFGTIFTATYITYFTKMRIDRIDGNQFILQFGTGPNASRSLAPLIGFLPVDTAASTSLTGDQPVALMGDPFLYVTIKDIGTLINEPYKDVFAKILLNVPPKSICYDSFASNAKIYRSPLTKLERFDVKYLTVKGDLYDFNSFDNSMILEVYTLPY